MAQGIPPDRRPQKSESCKSTILPPKIIAHRYGMWIDIFFSPDTGKKNIHKVIAFNDGQRVQLSTESRKVQQTKAAKIFILPKYLSGP